MKLTPAGSTKSRGWGWAYKKIRSFGGSRMTAFYRASLYTFRGDSGAFSSKRSWQTFRIRR
ncbi:hypothetical protein CRX42_00545 [Pseudomonas jessenii]|uniref:Uncharacterized protein n=1 Tax=Pseudomonas jessenii TaxID=77298 RepID=A0A2W0EVU4_PSEJE|nr:hypothetical protein CRX42_00545 [Pseudomonas jessenii]